MSISSALSNAVSGLNASARAAGVASTNLANVADARLRSCAHFELAWHNRTRNRGGVSDGRHYPYR